MINPQRAGPSTPPTTRGQARRPAPSTSPLRPGAAPWLAVFFTYALALFTLTHWPKLSIDVPAVERPDIYIHLAVFAGWTFLLNLTTLTGPFLRPRSILLAALVAALYAALDESLQAIPILQRTAAWDDLVANLLGVAAATVALLLIARLRTRRSR